jgi:cell division septation protein DedD
MPKNEDGGTEVMLGNRQLLSIFFIVVVLLGVFFTMGFVMGRNAASGGPAAAVPAPDGAMSKRASSPSPSGPAVETPPSSTPAQPAVEPVAIPPRPVEPAAGETFLQAIAAKRPEAEVIAEVLKKKGFPTMLAPSPDGVFVRVLVGPLADPAAIANTRTALEKAGFDKSIVRKY